MPPLSREQAQARELLIELAQTCRDQGDGPDTGALVVDLAAARRARTPDPSTFVPSHLARPMTNEQRRRAAERGIANARAALARARIREVRADG